MVGLGTRPLQSITSQAKNKDQEKIIVGDSDMRLEASMKRCWVSLVLRSLAYLDTTSIILTRGTM